MNWCIKLPQGSISCPLVFIIERCKWNRVPQGFIPGPLVLHYQGLVLKTIDLGSKAMNY